MFFIRSLLGLGVVFALLPVAPEDQDKFENISPIEAIGAAANAVRDMSGFCGRNPQTCEVGGKAAVALGYKAKYGAQQLLDRVNEKETEDGIATGAVPMQTEQTAPAIIQELPKPIIVQASNDAETMPKPRARPDI